MVFVHPDPHPFGNIGHLVQQFVAPPFGRAPDCPDVCCVCRHDVPMALAKQDDALLRSSWVTLARRHFSFVFSLGLALLLATSS